jgi:hypothetical protein
MFRKSGLEPCIHAHPAALYNPSRDGFSWLTAGTFMAEVLFSSQRFPRILLCGAWPLAPIVEIFEHLSSLALTHCPFQTLMTGDFTYL